MKWLGTTKGAGVPGRHLLGCDLRGNSHGDTPDLLYLLTDPELYVSCVQSIILLKKGIPTSNQIVPSSLPYGTPEVPCTRDRFRRTTWIIDKKE